MNDLGNACSSFSETEIKELREIASLYRDARGVVMQGLNYLGDLAKKELPNISENWQAKIGDAVGAALRASYNFAANGHPGESSQGWRQRAAEWAQGEKWHRNATALTGALGGVGGLATSVAELPFTTTLILHSIQQIAAGYGEDVRDEAVRQHCIGVFALGGPLAEDDHVELELFTTRLALQRSALNEIFKLAISRFATKLSQVAITRLIPLVGAVAGATINATFTSYYQDMAHVHFRLRRMERDHDPQQVQACFERILGQIRKSGKRA